MNLYELQGLTRIHGGRTVLEIEELQILSGRVYSLLGPNGAGKTSLLKILAFLDKPSQGKLVFQGQEVGGAEANLQKLRQRVVLLDQYPIMFTGTVAGNVGFGLDARGIRGQEKTDRISRALALVGMERFSDYPAQGLSGGETKRVALARALVLEPAVLLCDEPTANVDQENQEIILRILDQANVHHQTSIIFSTHHLAQGQRLAQHSLLLQNGRLSTHGGENHFRVRLKHHEGTVVCHLTGELRLNLPLSFSSSPHTDEATLSLDPDILRLHPANTSGDSEAWTGHVVSLVQEGGRVRVCVDIGLRLFVFLSLADYRKQAIGLGEKVQVEVPVQAARLTTRTVLE